MYDHITEHRPIPKMEAFPGILGDIVKALDPWTDADPIAMMATAITQASVMLEGKGKILMGGKWRTPQINTIAFGDSAIGAKGTSKAFTAMVFDKAFPEWEKNHVMVGAPSSGVGLVKRIANMAVGANHLVPVEDLDLNDEDMLEAMLKPLTRLKPSYPVMVYEEEFAKVLQRAKMDDTYEPMIRTMWQGGDATARISNTATVTLVSPVISWLCHITSDEFLARLGRASLAGGTFNRFIILFVKRTRELDWEEEVPEEILNPLAKELRKRIEWATDEGRFLATGGRLKYSDGFKQYYKQHVHPPYNAMLNGDKILRQFAGRARDYVKILSAIFAMLDYRTVMEAKDLKAAKAFMDYALDSLPIIMRELGEQSAGKHRVYIDGDSDAAKPAVCDWLKHYLIKNGPTPKQDLTKKVKGRGWTAQDINNAIVFHNGDIHVEDETGKVANRPTRMVEWVGPTEEPEKPSKPPTAPVATPAKPKVSAPRREPVRPAQRAPKPQERREPVDIFEGW